MNVNETDDQTIKDVVCNMCGLTCILQPNDCGDIPCGLIGAEVMGGYDSTPGNGSGALDDMTMYTFSLCEFCLDHIFEKFVVPPKLTEEYNSPEEFRPASKRVTDDVWRKQVKEFFVRKEQRDIARCKPIHALLKSIKINNDIPDDVA